MAELWLGNVEESVSDEEIGEFLTRYGFPQYSSIRRVHGSGSRPVAVVLFEGITPDSLRTLQPRIHNLYWKNHTIVAQLIPERRED
jgi:hypothetical protein